MDFGFSYLQGRIRDATKSWQWTLDYNDEARLIRKANKISTVFNIMNFCQGEWKLSFNDSSSEHKNSINGKNDLFCLFLTDKFKLVLTKSKCIL